MANNNDISERLPFYVGWAMLGVMALTAFLLAYWMFWPITILEVQETHILNPDKIVKRGDYLRYSIKYKKHFDIVGDVTRTLVNDRTVALVYSDSSKKKLSICEQEIDVLIPPNMWPGKYKLKVDVRYDVNPLRTIRVQYQTDWFEIR